jgi:hypothetical protein
MKGIAKMLTLVFVSVLLFSNTVSAKSTNQYSDKPNGESINQSLYTPNELNQMKKIHKMIVKRGLAYLNSDGTIAINTNATELAVDKNMFEKYLKNIDDVNFVVTEGVASFDKEYNLKVESKDEITKRVYEKDQKQQEEPMISPMYVPNAPPTLRAYSIASSNRNTLKALYVGLANGIYGNAASAYSSTLGFWIAKVRPNGAWDYKVVSGYSPYNKEWSAIARYNTDYRTSEWFGNYNYGLTGHYLFSLSVLLNGGYFAGMGSEDANDKAAITQGYNEY